uniref:secreted frizzled-related protein 3 n=1 Tax=Myxine glutinosa TaxID=7769 RepID=UPI00358E3EA2
MQRIVPQRHRRDPTSLGTLVLALVVLPALCSPPASFAAMDCEPIRIPMCRSMLWNMTRMPNHLHHSTQENAILSIEQFQELLAMRCSPVLAFFLCALYAPICTISFQQEPVKPCRALCEAARASCEPVMRRYDYRWPESMACEELPVYERGVCISPEAIVTHMPDDEDTQGESGIVFMNTHHHNDHLCRGRAHDKDSCKCKTFKMNQRMYAAKKFHYVIRVGVKQTQQVDCEEIQTTVQVKEVLKSSVLNISQGEVQIYTNSSCLCPKVVVNKEYLIMGYEDHGLSRLFLFDGCVAEDWEERLRRKVKRWDQRLQRRRNGRGRKRKRGRKRESSKERKRKMILGPRSSQAEEPGV